MQAGVVLTIYDVLQTKIAWGHEMSSVISYGVALLFKSGPRQSVQLWLLHFVYLYLVPVWTLCGLEFAVLCALWNAVHGRCGHNQNYSKSMDCLVPSYIAPPCTTYTALVCVCSVPQL